MPIRPENGSLVQQTPPDFSWPHQGRGQYQFRLTRPDGSSADRMVTANFMHWPEELPPGRYAWQIRFWPQNGATSEWSLPRSFIVPPNAWPFVLGDLDALYDEAARRPRPRTLPTGSELVRLRAELLTGARRNRFVAFAQSIEGKVGGPMATDVAESAADHDDIVERRKAEGRIVAQSGQEVETMLGMAFAGVIREQPDLISDAKRRLLNMAGWSIHGGTGNGSYAIASQTISRAMTLVYDWIHPHLAPGERLKILDHIVARQGGLFDWYIVDSPRLQIQPRDGHGYLHLGNLAAVAAVLAGDAPNARAWLRETLPLYASLLNPWGGEDSGYANGMNYAFYDVQFSFLHWDMLRGALGLDLTRKAWARNFGLLMTYMHPPGAPVFVFGDGAGNGDDPLVSTVARAYAARSNTMVGNWYAGHWQRSFPVPALYELLSPLPSQVPARATGPSPDQLMPAAAFPTTGWVAMHSDLNSRMRNSVYFKSSPFGSYNHAHADQNSFVIHSRGRELAINSGYFYLYNSPHWTNWTKQTRAHNAITYNGGQGQTFDSRAARGRLTAFSTSGQFDQVSGDATEAYGGNLKKARRTLAYLRPDTVVVFDSLEHYEPVRFEWNIHSKNNMVRFEPNKIGFAEGAAALCVEMHDPDGKLDFLKFNEFTSPVEPPYEYLPQQWHGRFFVRAPEAKTEFLAVLRIDCAGPGLADVRPIPNGGYTLTLGGTRYAIDEAGFRPVTP